MEPVGPPPLDRGRVVIRWILQVFAGVVAVLLALVALGGGISSINHRVDPSTVPLGRPYWTIVSPTGTSSYIDCPSLVASVLGDRDPLCSGETRSTALILGGVSLACGAFAWLSLLSGRSRRRIKAMAVHDVGPPPTSYRQASMPLWYHLAVPVVMAFTITLAFGVAIAVANGQPATVVGPVFWAWISYQVVWVTGCRRAYLLDLDRDGLVWKAPLRTTTIPLSDVAVVFIPEPGTFLTPERTATVEARSGATFSVGIPDDLHRWRFRRFCETLRSHGVPVVDTPSAAPPTPR